LSGHTVIFRNKQLMGKRILSLENTGDAGLGATATYAVCTQTWSVVCGTSSLPLAHSGAGPATLTAAMVTVTVAAVATVTTMAPLSRAVASDQWTRVALA
jgi:hypothetical protein